jgi:two-component system nitrate/nitrite response regulator NarL
MRENVMNQDTRRTLFAGYNRLFREGMRLLLGDKFDLLDCVDSFEDALDAMRAGNLNLDLLIGDPGTHTTTELSAISEISREFPQVKIIILAAQTTQAMLDALLQSGVGGVLSNDISTTALLYSIEIVLLGERIVPTILSSGTGVTSPASSAGANTSELGNALSPRERQILHCLVEGLPNKSIARNLATSEATVKVHLKMLLRKLRIQNRTQAAVWALNHGFCQSDDSHVDEIEIRPNTMLENEAAQRRQTPDLIHNFV